MHEREIKAIWYILDLICGDEYLKEYFQKRLLKRNVQEWKVIDLLFAFRKIVNQIDEIDRPEVDIPIMQDLKVRIIKDV